ncbi:SRPBCC family protein [Halomarina pelagica]|uniref:SRPBCC family protein n=1 Tax=Halomarina pelagica TaxID=2961599 RepID=UPI0020C241DB|nr:SRPBCC family protein [Halomarina sp. BND7]
MPEVTVSRFVRAPPRVVLRRLTPGALVAYEGSFAVREVHERDDGRYDARDDGGATVVTAGARGLELALRFEERPDGWYYTQEGDAGPFDAMETWVTVEAEDEGSRVTMRSAVDLGLPIPALSGRVAAWKRRGELNRALSALAADC